MAEKLANIIVGLSNEKEEIDLILLVDGSSSIILQHWEVTTFSLRNVVGRINFARSRCAIVQYSGTARIEHEFSNDRYSLNMAINGMKQMKSITNTGAGLTLCGDLFAANPRDARRIIILLTDGVATDSPENKALELRERRNVTIYGIGVGDVSQFKLEAITSLDCCFLIESMEHLRSLFAKIGTQAYKKPDITVLRRHCNQIDIQIACSEHVSEFHVELFNAENDTPDKYKLCNTVSVPIPEEAIVSTSIKGLKPNSAVNLRIYGILKKSGLKTAIATLTDKTLVEKPESEVLKKKELLLAAIDRMRKEIQDWKPNESVQSLLNMLHAKLILLGRVGEGKSSFINTLFSALLGEYASVAITMEDTKSVTPSLNEHYLPNTVITVMDSFGWETDNYPEDQQRLIMQGALGDGYREGDSHTDYVLKANENGNNSNVSSFAMSVHAVILVCDADAVTNKSYMTRLKQFETTWKRYERPTILILTKPDNADHELREHPELIYDSETVERHINTLVKATGISRGDIYPVINRTTMNDTNPEVRDYLALKALRACLFSAVEGRLRAEADKAKKRRYSLTPTKALSQLSLSSPTSPSTVAVPTAPQQPLAPTASTAAEKLVLMIPFTGNDHAVQYFEVRPREPTLDALKEAIVAIKPFGLSSVDEISQVSAYKTRNSRVFEVIMHSDDEVRELESGLEIVFKKK